jgi:hypothetical protein
MTTDLAESGADSWHLMAIEMRGLIASNTIGKTVAPVRHLFLLNLNHANVDCLPSSTLPIKPIAELRTQALV